MRELGGALTAIVTPFDATGALNLEMVPPFLEFQKANGIDGVVVCGTNGEGTSLSVEEHKRLLEAVLRHRNGLLVIAGTGAASLPDAIEMTRHAGEAGADAALVLPPFFYKNVSPDGVAGYFRRVLDAANLPVLLYSIPQFSMVEVTDAVIDRVKGHPRFVGLKDSKGDWERTGALLRERPDLCVFPGSDELLGRALKAGAPGAISGTANAFPDLVSAVVRAKREGGDIDAAQAQLDIAKNVLVRYPLIAVSKSVLVRRGLPRMHVRPPLVDLTADQERDLATQLAKAGLPGA